MAVSTAVFTDSAGQVRLAGTLTTTGTATGDFSSATISTGAISALVASTGVKVGATGDKLGFYGTAPISLQTGVAVSSAGIHAALVALGLITA